MTGVVARAAIAAAAALTAMAIAVAAIGFLVAALYFWLLAIALAPWLAALVVGLVLLGLAGLVVAALWLRSATLRRSRALAHHGRSRVFSVADLGDRAAREAVAVTEDHPHAAASAAFLAGLALGRSRELRDLVMTALKASSSATK